MLIVSQNKEKVLWFGRAFNALEYSEQVDHKGKKATVRHTICISDGCLEEIAYLNGWITKEDVLKVYEILKKNQYGQYLKDVLDGKYLDVLH